MFCKTRRLHSSTDASSQFTFKKLNLDHGYFPEGQVNYWCEKKQSDNGNPFSITAGFGYECGPGFDNFLHQRSGKNEPEEALWVQCCTVSFIYFNFLLFLKSYGKVYIT